jgi:hypothetical protein
MSVFIDQVFIAVKETLYDSRKIEASFFELVGQHLAIRVIVKSQNRSGTVPNGHCSYGRKEEGKEVRDGS